MFIAASFAAFVNGGWVAAVLAVALYKIVKNRQNKTFDSIRGIKR